MSGLSKNWITEKLIDFEYKKYVLLAYLQEVSRNFEQAHLYPSLGELVSHYRNVIAFRESKQSMFEKFPERLEKADLEHFSLVFKKIVEDDALMQEIESIVDFSIPEFEKRLQDGRKVYEFIEEKINIQPVGVLPLNPSVGYILLCNGSIRETRVYEYQVSFYENPNEKYRSIQTQHISSYARNLSNTFESIKSDLLRWNRKLPNPATFAIESEMTFPLAESLFPVVKRSFMKYLAESGMTATA